MKRKSKNCRPPYRISEAGHLLVTRGSSRAGIVLATAGKAEKRKRKKRGCLSGTGGTFRLTAKQKRNLPLAMQRGLIAYQRRLGKKILP